MTWKSLKRCLRWNSLTLILWSIVCNCVHRCCLSKILRNCWNIWGRIDNDQLRWEVWGPGKALGLVKSIVFIEHPSLKIEGNERKPWFHRRVISFDLENAPLSEITRRNGEFLVVRYSKIVFTLKDRKKCNTGSSKMPVNSAGFYLSCAKTVHLARLSPLYWHSGDGSGHRTYQSREAMRRKRTLEPLASRSVSFKGHVFLMKSP